MSERKIPDVVLQRQYTAADPAVSAWVSANAGSGKTYVLAQRVVRLLLDGTDPGKILCLTYTKAAAANMANRVFSRLANWATLEETLLRDELRRLGLRRIDGPRLAAARKLFARALETPGGLKVQTIHAFCTRLLQQFPFEADVPARFQVLEETQQAQALETIRRDVLLDASARPASAEGEALTLVIREVSDFAFETALKEAIDKRSRIAGWLAAAGGIDAAMRELSRSLEVPDGQTVAEVETALFERSLLSADQWTALAAALRIGSTNDRKLADRIVQMRAGSAHERVRTLVEVFCKSDGTSPASLVTKKTRQQHAPLCTLLDREQDRACALLERRRALIARERSRALLTLAVAVIDRYRLYKEARGLLDYDDLIAKARTLLSDRGAGWVHYKLDLGIDHLLVDEAQDTSPEQWEIIERLVGEFAAGAGARGALSRSIFAVGDEKQSIYSFQGADPRKFDEQRRSFSRSFAAANKAWADVRLEYSFRSNTSVLTAVQHVFATSDVFHSVTADPAGISPHNALEDAAPGYVEIWPLIEAEKRPPPVAWDAPFDRTSETSPRVKLANRIATTVRRWIDRKEMVGTGAERHPVRPGDILVLVRQRGPLFEAVIRALKNRGIEVAGADRLTLTEHIAIMDLLALADALLLPDDDLALATVLKSPLFGLDEEALYDLAHGRAGRLIDSLRERRPELARRLATLAGAARERSPFAFYAELLGADRARRRFLSRLGPEANDVLDEFLNLALDYEGRETPSLQGFVAWLRTASAQIKRDMEIARDEVRVMTVHGAKGLEAPIVILADTTTEPQGPNQHQPRLLNMDPPPVPGRPGPLIWAARKDDDTPPIAAARQTTISDAIDEYRRLLYVAMTRAADRLVICGSNGVKSRPRGCWYDLMQAALQPHCVEMPADIGEGTVLRYCKSPPAPEALALDLAPPATPSAEPPAWLEQRLPELVVPAPLSPSQAYEQATPPPAASGEARQRAIARGTVMHRLLQSLPLVPAAQRREAAQQHLRRRGFAGAEVDDLTAKALRIMDDPAFAELFRAGSRAEAPIAGQLVLGGRSRTVVGVIDRLVLCGAGVLIADFKTNRAPPRRITDVPQAYVAQLALYRAILARLYPGGTVRAALVWTEVPELMEVPAAAMDAALAAMTATLTSP